MPETNVTHHYKLPEQLLKLIEYGTHFLDKGESALNRMAELWAAQAKQINKQLALEDTKEIDLAKQDAILAELRARKRKADFELSAPMLPTRNPQPQHHNPPGQGKRNKHRNENRQQQPTVGTVAEKTSEAKPFNPPKGLEAVKLEPEQRSA